MSDVNWQELFELTGKHLDKKDCMTCGTAGDEGIGCVLPTPCKNDDKWTPHNIHIIHALSKERDELKAKLDELKAAAKCMVNCYNNPQTRYDGLLDVVEKVEKLLK